MKIVTQLYGSKWLWQRVWMMRWPICVTNCYTIVCLKVNMKIVTQLWQRVWTMRWQMCYKLLHNCMVESEYDKEYERWGEKFVTNQDTMQCLKNYVDLSDAMVSNLHGIAWIICWCQQCCSSSGCYPLRFHYWQHGIWTQLAGNVFVKNLSCTYLNYHVFRIFTVWYKVGAFDPFDDVKPQSNCRQILLASVRSLQ